tara:strand:+ start:1063 stop:1962 length:900 start_codon:yes stop_codon:yes gene_type:complete
MKLRLITWNINFIHDRWIERLANINKILEKETDTTDIIAIQEATLPFNNKIKELHTFLKKKNINYFDTSLMERNVVYKYILEYFPKYKKYIVSSFEFLMNKSLWVCGYIFSNWGEYMKNLYFKYPYLFLFISLVCIPIFFITFSFIGLLTVVSKRIKTTVKSKYIGNRIIQYFDFDYNKKAIRFVHVHLPPGNTLINKEKRLDDIKEIVNFCKKKKNVIISGDFNDTSSSNMYKYMMKNNYKSSVVEALGKEIKTFPSKNPIKCIDYIMIKGDISVTSAIIFGNAKASDHKGIKVELDI